MKHLPLIWAGLWRKPARTIFTMICVAVAFLLFGLLQGVDSAFSLVIQKQKLDRVFVDPRVGIGQPLPLSYKEQIQRVPGIKRITEVSFMAGSYQDPKNIVIAIMTNPAVWLAIRPEYHVPADQIAAVTRTRTGVIISDWLAQKNGWKIGDQFTLRARLPNKGGNTDWTFQVCGIMTNPDNVGEVRIMLANSSYLDEARAAGSGTVNRFLMRIDDAQHMARIGRQIDALFANSTAPTRTQSEQEQAQSQVASVGDVNFFTRAIMGAVFFTLLILTANTMAESVRERTSELAVLKTLGYPESGVLILVLSEAVLLCVITSLLGLAIAAALFPMLDNFIGTGTLPSIVVALGVIFATGVAVLSAIIPGWRAMRLNIVDALAVR